MVTLKDIAEHLNVSIPLVSKVLNNSRSTVGVSEKTAERIRKVATDLGYVRNRSAVALRKGRHDSIGVLIQAVGAPGFNLAEQILSQVSHVAFKYGQQLQLGFYDNNEEFDLVLSRMTRAAVDGIIVAGSTQKSFVDKLLEVQQGGLPVVTINIDQMDETIVNVGTVEDHLCALPVDHLVSQGCRKIAHIAVIASRTEGFKKAIAKNGLEVCDELIIDVARDNQTNEHVSMAAGVAAIKRLVDSGVEFDGLTTQCDSHSMAALKVLFEAGIKVPDQVKIVGLDNSPVCTLGFVPLSSVDHNMKARTTKAVELLLKARSGEKIESVEFEPELIVRESSGGQSSQ